MRTLSWGSETGTSARWASPTQIVEESATILVGESGVESIGFEPAYDRVNVVVQVIATPDERDGCTKSDS